ncbi:hypothetical protein GCM10009727_42990 [Actinomadura napierensis]|uniref:Uncharacterized protein n=1 Tax=Actinomadura napierensis TaxID=267854 RepID=A0ABP5L9P9_9ACTN
MPIVKAVSRPRRAPVAPPAAIRTGQAERRRTFGVRSGLRTVTMAGVGGRERVVARGSRFPVLHSTGRGQVRGIKGVAAGSLNDRRAADPPDQGSGTARPRTSRAVRGTRHRTAGTAR